MAFHQGPTAMDIADSASLVRQRFPTKGAGGVFLVRAEKNS